MIICYRMITFGSEIIFDARFGLVRLKMIKRIIVAGMTTFAGEMISCAGREFPYPVPRHPVLARTDTQSLLCALQRDRADARIASCLVNGLRRHCSVGELVGEKRSCVTARTITVIRGREELVSGLVAPPGPSDPRAFVLRRFDQFVVKRADGCSQIGLYGDECSALT